MDNNAKPDSWFGRSQKKLIKIGIPALLILAATGSLYAMGYRVTRHLSFGKIGTVQVEIPLAGTAVFADASKKVVTAEDGEIVSFAFSPTVHTVLIARDGYFPWKKDVDVPKGGLVVLHPFFVTKNATGEIITTIDPEYFSIKSKVEKHPFPTKEKPFISEDGTASLWIEDNAILVEKTAEADSARIVIQPDTIIKNAEFYKDRSDVILFSSSAAVYAIEADKAGGQNFMPVYSGENPDFTHGGAGFIYVLDGSNLMQVVI